MKTICIVLSFILSSTASAATRHNDDSCDIALLPAATLLLPYFEVDLEDPMGETTLVTVTNVSPADQIARVTLWTDYAVPTITFNLYLTGYDVQSINLYDLIGRGFIAPDAGTGTRVTNRGRYSDGNPNLDLGACAQLPGRLSDAAIIRMQSAFTEGTVADFGDLQHCDKVGREHDNAVGYATIDLVRNCSTNNPFSEEYWTEDLAFENVLIGDSQQIHSGNNFAQGSPMVHVRAIPEGGTIAQRLKLVSPFPRTFYARYQPALSPNLDGRQPLPSVFAARWIEGGSRGFSTDMKIWREAETGREATCEPHDNGLLEIAEVVVFDESENAFAQAPSTHTIPDIPAIFLPATSLTSVDDHWIFPQADNDAVSGWLYLNLDSPAPGASSNWVASSMRAEGRYSVDIHAAALGNGCSAPVPASEATYGNTIIGPRP